MSLYDGEAPEEPPKEKVPFMECLIHENRKAYKKWILWISCIIDALAALIFSICAMAFIWGATNGFITSVVSMAVSAIVSVAVTIVSVWCLIFSFAVSINPLWYFGFVIIAAPFIYSLVLCLNRRYPEKMKSAAFILSVLIAIVTILAPLLFVYLVVLGCGASKGAALCITILAAFFEIVVIVYICSFGIN